MKNPIDFDRKHIWHPYTSAVEPLPTYEVVSAEGVRLTLANGKTLIDGMSSWWCAIHGYNHPTLNEAIQTQIKSMSHVMFGGITHQPAIQLAEKIIDITPNSLKHVFFSDSGSVSVEVAIKMAMQYWNAQGRIEKSRLLTIRGGYHGDTFGAMSVCDPETGMHERFQSVLPQHIFMPRPQSRVNEPLDPLEKKILEETFEKHHKEVAAVILDPIVQGAGGMWFYSDEYLKHISILCKQYNVLLILDEIATGFGRTGKLFACEHAQVEPDIMCLGKAMTGGYMTQAATLTNRRVAEGISTDGGVLMHGPTFMANPLACAVSLASIELLLSDDWSNKIAGIETQLVNELAKYKSHSTVVDIRAFGAIGVVQTKEPVNVSALQKVFVKHDVWIRPFNDLIYIMPPFVIQPDELLDLTDAIGIGLDSIETT